MADHRPLAKSNLDQQQINNDVFINGNDPTVANLGKNLPNSGRNYIKTAKTVGDEQSTKSRKRDRRRRPHKYENKMTDSSNSYSSMPHENSNQYNDKQVKKIFKVYQFIE